MAINLLPQEEEQKIDLLGAKPPAVLPKDVLEERSIKYHMALGDASPGLDKVASLIASPGGEGILQQHAAVDEQNKRRSATIEMFKDTSVDQETLTNAIEGARQPVNPESVISRRLAEAEIGTSLVLTKNPDEVNADHTMSAPMHDFVVQEQQKYEDATKLLQDLEARRSQRLWGDAAVDFAKTLFPFYSEALQRDEESTILGKDFPIGLPGSNRQEQYKYIQSLPPEEAAKVSKAFAEHLASKNIDVAVSWVAGLQGGYSGTAAGLDNIFFGLDAAGLLPAERLLSLGKGFAARKAAVNIVKTDAQRLAEGWKIVTETPGLESDAQKLAKGWDVGELYDNSVSQRLLRTKLAASQPGAKVDNILAGAGHQEEASRMLALDMAKTMAPDAGATVKKELSDILPPMLYNPKQFLVESSTAHIERASNLAARLTANSEAFVNAFRETLNVDRIPLDVRRLALDETEKAFRQEMKQMGMDRAIIGQVRKFDTNTSGVNIGYIEAKLGRKDQTWFASAAIAENTAKNRYNLLDGSYEIVQEGDGYGILLRKDIDETNKLIREALINTENKTNTARDRLFGIVPVVSKRISGAKNNVSLFAQQQRQALVHAATAIEHYAQKIAEPLGKLSKDQTKALEKVLEANRREYKVPGDPASRGKWYNNVGELERAYIDLNGRLPTDEEVLAYGSMRQLSDMDYVFRAVNEVKAKSREGYNRIEVSFNGKSSVFEGKEVDDLPWNSTYEASVYVAQGKGKVYRLNENGFKALAKQLQGKGFKAVKVFDPDFNKFKDTHGIHGGVNYVLTPTLKKGALRFDEQLGYRPGFHVRYKQEHFVKQGNISRSSTGQLIYNGDSVVLGSDIAEKARKEAGWLERARKAYNEKNDAELAALVKEGFPYDVSEVKRNFKSGAWRADTPFSYVRQGQSTATVPTINGRSLADEVGEFRDYSNSPHNDSLKFRNEYTGQKDGPLYSIKEGTEDNPLSVVEEAPMLDVFGTQSEAMSRLIRDRLYNDYQIGAAEAWTKEFEDLIWLNDKKVSASELARNPLYYLEHGTVKSPNLLKDARAVSAQSAQASIQNLMRHSSFTSKAITHTKSKLVDFVYSKGYTKTAGILDDKLAWMAVDIPTKFRAAAFHTKQGLFNIKQLFIQGNTLVSLNALNPTHGPGATLTSMFMKYGALWGDDASMVAASKLAAKTNPDWTAEEFLDSWKNLKRTNFDQVGRERSMLNDISDPKLFRGKIGKFLDWGAWPVTAPDSFVRVAAWNTAYKEYTKKFPNLIGKLSQDDVKYILNRADDLSMSMTRAGHSVWQEGDFSMMTQYWGYNARVFDALTGNRFTSMEKARLLMGHAIMYGIPVSATSLLPAWNWSNEIRQHLYESGVDPNSGLTDVIMNGAAASALAGITYYAFGEEMQFDIGGRWGPGSIPILQNLLDTRRDETGFDELMQFAGGASGTIIQDIAKDTYQLARSVYMTTEGEGGWNVMLQDLNNLGRNVSSYNAAEKIWQAYNTGMYKSKTENLVDSDYDVFEGIFEGLTGIPKQETQDTYLKFLSADETNKLEQKIMKSAKRWIKLALEARRNGDDDLADEYEKRVKAEFAAGNFREDQMHRAWKDTIKDEDESLKLKADDAFVKAPNALEEQKLREEMNQ